MDLDSLRQWRKLCTQIKVGGLEHLVWGEPIGLVNDDSELGRKTGGEFVKARVEVALESFGDEIVCDISEENG